MNPKRQTVLVHSDVGWLGCVVLDVPRPRSGPHSWRTAGRPLPHGEAVFEDPGCTPRVATTVESRLPCGGTILACRLMPGRSPQMPQPHATRCVLFAQPSAQRADGVGVGGWDQKCAVGIVGLVPACVCVRWGSVLSSLPRGHPFCTGWTVAARQACS